MKIVALKTPKIDLTKYFDAIAEELDLITQEVKEHLLRPTQFWDAPVQFDVEGERFDKKVTTQDLRYLWTNNGTPQHIIPARTPERPLKFEVGTRPKTRPGSLEGDVGTFQGDGLRTAQSITHPGTKPRNFDQSVAVLMNRGIGVRVRNKMKQKR